MCVRMYVIAMHVYMYVYTHICMYVCIYSDSENMFAISLLSSNSKRVKKVIISFTQTKFFHSFSIKSD